VPTVVADGGAASVGIIGAGLLLGRGGPSKGGPSEPPDTKLGHKRRQPVNSWSIKRKQWTHTRLYGHAGGPTHSWGEYRACAVWSRDTLVSRFPCGAHARV